ncbi:unnamed protein product [Scytosiphon promiscuus]
MRTATRGAMGHLAGLPRELLAGSMGYLGIVDLGEVCSVSREWRKASEEDGVWRFWWLRRFREDPPPQRARAREGHLKLLHRYRFNDPLVGDKVEVSWEGRFRLESLDVFVGKSWWEATVVQKLDGYMYRIHYPGWDSNWDEWVVRDRLRWPIDPSYLSTAFKVRDVVEVWRMGTHVKGAWLQARVRQIKDDQVSLKNVLASSPRTIWVPRANCRLVCAGRSGSIHSSSGSSSASTGSGRGRRRGRFSKLDASRKKVLTRTMRGLSASARRLPLAGLAGLRAAVRKRVGGARMRRRGDGGGGGGDGDGARVVPGL